MSRRSHRKSKTGCLRCKRRHIKCDEHRPICINCTTAGFECIFQHAVGVSAVDESRASQLNEVRLAIDNKIVSTPVTTRDGLVEINVLDLQLFHHFISELTFLFWSTTEYKEKYKEILVSNALKHQYLMSELLAFSALHMSDQMPELKKFYREVATSYQNRALSSLKECLDSLDESNCIAVLLLSNLIGLHSFRDVFASLSESNHFNEFLIRLTHVINLQRGIRAVMSPRWKWFWSSEIGPIIQNTYNIRQQSAKMNGSETEMLKQFILSSDLKDSTRELFLETIRNLQIDFNQLKLSADPEPTSAQGLFAWVITLSNEFIILLEAEMPEALLILSYFGVILHRYRNFWLVHDAGRVLVNFVISRLGLSYSPCLVWADEQTKLERSNGNHEVS
ncbi:uncharacterized protein V1516DRAFT_663224 [Lipomyces oligophaga]|uniref:uncharacterized protein n=1 Tax=Lipomyces oligophaga TaxID=45792 RepID=UPI0034CECA8B